jgi:hypothetical protein
MNATLSGQYQGGLANLPSSSSELRLASFIRLVQLVSADITSVTQKWRGGSHIVWAISCVTAFKGRFQGTTSFLSENHFLIVCVEKRTGFDTAETFTSSNRIRCTGHARRVQSRA